MYRPSISIGNDAGFKLIFLKSINLNYVKSSTEAERTSQTPDYTTLWSVHGLLVADTQASPSLPSDTSSSGELP